MDNDFKNKIIDDIHKTGFPSELKIGAILKNRTWSVEHNPTYTDLETENSREVDIVASRFRGKKTKDGQDIKFVINVTLVIEVKKSSKRPWVFFTVPYIINALFNKSPAFGMIHHSINFSTQILSAKELMEDFPRNFEDNYATSFYEAFKSPDEPSKIYEAIMSSVKAAYYIKRRESMEDLKTQEQIDEEYDKEFDPNDFQRIDFFIPIIILDGILCKAILREDNKIELNESQYIPLEISHSAKPYNNYWSYYPEIVHIDYFETYLLGIEKWIESMIQTWDNNLEKKLNK